MIRMRTLCVMLLVTISAMCRADEMNARREIHFPSLPPYMTLACDLHMHTVFSDGYVWPSVRVAEAWRLGLDAIAITDHIEYRPNKKDLPADFARSYELAEGAAKAHGLLLVKGAEITRETPPGHFNALFLKDIKPLDTPEFLDAIKQANEQDAYVFWNHQGWQGEEKGRWLDVHTKMFENKSFQGMEVANGDEYYPTAHKLCLEKNLTMMGNSDIHDPDLRRQSLSGDHRTMTLVFAKERSLAGLKEALLAGRTVVWYKDQLIGREEFLRPLFEACLRVGKPTVVSPKGMTVQLRNECQADIILEPVGSTRPMPMVVPARSTILLRTPPATADRPAEMKFTATNFLIGPGQGMPITLKIPGP